jgi:magnesium-transporting ATPase (P-type)
MKLYKKTLFSIFLLSLLIPFLAKAITIPNPLCDPASPDCTSTFQDLIEKIINFIFYVAMAIVPIMIIVAAFYFLTSGGNPEQVNKAKKILLFTFIGLFIVLLGKGIVAIIKQVLGGGS